MKSARHNGLLYLVLLLGLLFYTMSCSKKVNHAKTSAYVSCAAQK